MNKKLILLTFFIIFVVLIGCDGTPTSEDLSTTLTPTTTETTQTTDTQSTTTTGLSAEDFIALDMANLDFSEEIDFPMIGENGTRFSFSSSNPQVITDSGTVINPPVGSEPVDVTITASGYYEGVTVEEDFVVTVDPMPEAEVTSSRLLPFSGTSKEYVVADIDEVEIFYVNEGTVPYIDVETFLTMMDGAIDSSLLTFTEQNNALEISYEVEYEDFDGSLITESNSMTIDFETNVVTANNYSFFENYVAETTSDFGEGLNYVDAEYVDGSEIVIPLSDYRFDLLTYDDGTNDNYLMPFHVANLLFAGSIYYDVYYNGDSLMGVDTFTISSNSASDLATQEEIRTSSYNDENMSEDLKFATYNFLALAFDYFYGLKAVREIDTYYDVLQPYADRIISQSDGTVYSSLFEFVNKLDDLHSSHVFTGYYTDPTNSIQLELSDLGSEVQTFYQGLWRIQDLIDANFDDGVVPTVRTLSDGTTAVIYIDGFTIDTPDEVKNALDNLAPAIENVVFDLAYNTGGNVGAVFRTFGYMTENAIQYHSKNPTDGSAYTYYIESDYTAYDFDWYILTSSVTFSAANMMASIAKELDIATIIGQDSSGGASSISTIMTPDGTCLLVSSTSVSSTRVYDGTDYEYLSIEEGIEVDHELLNPYDDEALAALIAEIESNTTS